MTNQNSLKVRIMQDEEFFKRLFSQKSKQGILAEAQKKYPEAIEYEKVSGRIYFSSSRNGMFRWVELRNGKVIFQVVYVPSKEDDE